MLENILLKFCVVAQAVCLAELLLKFRLYCSLREILFSNVFAANIFQNVGVFGIFLSSSIFIWFFSPANSQGLFAGWCAYLVLWLCVRPHIIYSKFYQSQVVKETNSLVGPGLALNFYNSFLNFLFKAESDGGDLAWKLRMEFENELNKFLKKEGVETGTKGLGLVGFDKLVVLLPDNCILEDEENSLGADHVYQVTDLKTMFFKADPSASSLTFSTRPGQKDINIDISWIYMFKEDQDQPIKRPDAEKIFFVRDFPMLLKSCMSPDKGWDRKTRETNIEAFVETVKRLCSASSCDKKIVFSRYSVEDGVPISDHIRSTIESSAPSLFNKQTSPTPQTTAKIEGEVAETKLDVRSMSQELHYDDCIRPDGVSTVGAPTGGVSTGGDVSLSSEGIRNRKIGSNPQ